MPTRAWARIGVKESRKVLRLATTTEPALARCPRLSRRASAGSLRSLEFRVVSMTCRGPGTTTRPIRQTGVARRSPAVGAAESATTSTIKRHGQASAVGFPSRRQTTMACLWSADQCRRSVGCDRFATAADFPRGPALPVFRGGRAWCGRSGQRKPDRDGSASSHLRLKVDFTIELKHQLATDRQSQSASLDAGMFVASQAKEWFEHMLAGIARNTRSRVGNSQAPTMGVTAGAESDSPAWRRVFQGVGDEVSQDLLAAGSVGDDHHFGYGDVRFPVKPARRAIGANCRSISSTRAPIVNEPRQTGREP